MIDKKLEELYRKRLKVCFDIHYFGYGTLCNNKHPCDNCKKILEVKK